VSEQFGSSTRRVAVVGIDGSGKSSVVRRFLQLCRSPSVAAMSCPAYHETPDAPLSALSRQLDALSRTSDELGSFELKAAALYLQMTLFGAVERFFVDTYRPQWLLCERHALIDTLTYSPFYRRMVKGPADRAALEGPLRRALGEALDPVLRWLETENRRLGLGYTLWDAGEHVVTLLSRPMEEVVPELARRYRTTLPDVVLMLDTPAAVAHERVVRRDSGRELHEQAAVLEQLRQSYHHTLGALGSSHPEVQVRILATGDGCSIDDVLGEVVEQGLGGGQGGSLLQNA